MPANRLHHYLVLTAAPALCWVGCGGPEPLRPESMVPRDADLVFKSSGKSCYLSEVEGRKEKCNLLIYYVTAPELRKAIEEGLNGSRLFASVSTNEGDKADYTLAAHSLGQPTDGRLPDTASLYVRYRLTRNDTGETVFDKMIRSDCAPQDDVGWLERYRLAVEGATRENIRQLLVELSKVGL